MASCSANTGSGSQVADPTGTGGAAGSGGDGSDAAAGNAGSAGLTGSGGGLMLDSSAGDSSADGPSCAGEVSTAELLPLDMYIMLDDSGSMNQKTTSGASKWSAITQALSAFLADPQSVGLGVGLQFFAVLKPGVPLTCTTQAECGTSGPCLLKACAGSTTLDACTKNADCGFLAGPCDFVGKCSADPSYYCVGAGPTGNPQCGTCVQLTSSFCVNGDSCDVADYTAPAVEIQPLPGPEAAINAAIAKQQPFSSTPTGPALQGAVDHAKTWAAANPTHKVVAVLATDGQPTECTPTDIPSVSKIASDAVLGTPSIKTFVIGVFAPGDPTAQQNLDAIAAGGGTAPAVIIDTSQNVTQKFIDALNAIRGSQLACDYQIPLPKDGGTIDPKKINVQYTPTNGQTETLIYVGDASKCDPQNGGWYYDDANAPTKIIMCDSTCNGFKASAGKAQVEIRVGCQTVIH
jgi:hypothetical protein